MKFERKLRWQGILLCFLLVNQFFGSIAKRIESHHHHNEPFRKVAKRIQKREQSVDGVLVLGKDQCHSNEIHHREKRFIVTALFIASIVVTLANIGFDIYLQIKKCEGLFPSIRTNVDEFERLRKELVTRSNDMSRHYTESQNVLEYTRAANVANMGLMVEVKRIMTITIDIMEALSPQDENRLINKSIEIQAELRKHNATVERFNLLQLEQEYEGIFRNWKNSLLGLTPILGVLGQVAVSKLWNWYKLSKITKTVQLTSGQLATSSKARSFFGVKNVNSAVSATAKAQQKGLSAISKVAKIGKFAGALMSVVSIGLDIYVAIKKVEACKEQRDQSKKALDTIRPEINKFKETEKELVEFRMNVTTAYNDVKGVMTSETFFGYINTIKTLTDNVDNAPGKVKQASQDITKFLKLIKNADRDKTHELQTILDAALRSFSFTMNCLKKKIQTLAYTHQTCIKGDGSMKTIFQEALVLFKPNAGDCTSETGHEYTSFEATNVYISDRMRKENYQPDCILNSKDMKILTCGYYVEEYSMTAMQEKTGLNAAQVSFFTKACPLGEISPKLKTKICLSKSFTNFAKVKDLYKRYDQKKLEETYKACALPPMSDAVKSVICLRKKSGRSLASVRSEYSQYPTAPIDSAYRACVEPEIPAEVKDNICNLKRKHDFALSIIVNSYKAYPKAKVEATYNAC